MSRIALSLIAAGFVALSSAAAGAEQPLKNVELGIGGRTLFSYLPLTLAERLGYFRDEGLRVNVNDFQGGSKSIEALVGGSVDFVAGAYENTLFLQAKGIDLKAIVLLTDRFGLVFALRKEFAPAYRSPKDVKGMKIGVTAPGSAVSNALEIILAKDGLTAKDVSVIGIGGGPGAVAAVKAGQVDGLVLSDPAISWLEADGVITPIVDSRKEDGQNYLYGGPNANSSVLVRAQFARENPDIVRSFSSALVRTMRWLHKASLDDVMALIPPDYYKADKEIYRTSLGRNLDGFTRDGHLTPELAAVTYRSMLNTGRLAGADRLDIARTLDDSFWQDADKRY